MAGSFMKKLESAHFKVGGLKIRAAANILNIIFLMRELNTDENVYCIPYESAENTEAFVICYYHRGT
jgi:hypothetical protein